MSGIQSPTPAVVIIGPPPPFPAAARSVDMSALGFVLGLIGVVSIPALIYTLFFAIRCPRRTPEAEPPPSSAGVPYSREIHGGECPVCLSAFGEGDEVKPLSACGHAFHAACVDEWLSSHPNCPVCRAAVPSAAKPAVAAAGSQRSSRHQDLHHGLPGAADLV